MRTSVKLKASILFIFLLGTLSALVTACGNKTPTSANNPTVTPIPATPTITFTPTAISPNGGVVTTLAGSGANGDNNGTASTASFDNPRGVAADPQGNVYVSDGSSDLIREIKGGMVSNLAGSAGVIGATNGTGTSASFHNPYGLVADSHSNVYVADFNNDLIRMITSGGVVSTLSGATGNATDTDNTTTTSATFSYPTDVAIDASGNIYVTDSDSVREIAANGGVTTLGGGSNGFANGSVANSLFNGPSGVAVDPSGNVYVADTGNNMIREITSGGVATTLAGQLTAGSANGTGTAASFNGPIGIVIDSLGTIYVTDTGNNMIRRITSGGVVTTLAGQTTAGSANGTGTAASFNTPYGIAVDSTGAIYVTDFGNQLIRKIQ